MEKKKKEEEEVQYAHPPSLGPAIRV